MVTLDNLYLRYGPQEIFRGVAAVIGARDRIGLVGSNGAGKTTLLRVLAGQEQLERGEVAKGRYVTVGYLPQDGLEVSGRPLFEEVESACEDVVAVRARLAEEEAALARLDPQSEDYAEVLLLIGELEHHLEDLDAARLKPRVEAVLHGLGFRQSDLGRDTAEFSGGWQMRIALAKLLLRSPDLLLLDEPTNHLDLPSQRWLENMLHGYGGALVMVSHDRAFLDRLTRRTFALSRGRMEVYAGNYSFFERESVLRRDQVIREQKNQAREIAKTERFIERFRYKATKARQVQSRVKALAKVERIEIEETESTVHFRFPPPRRCGHEVLVLEGVRKAYGELTVFEKLDAVVERGERVAVVGPNGAGKSTLARLLAGAEAPDAGERTVGHNVEIAWFAQHQATELDPESEVLEVVEGAAHPDLKANLRTLLGSFLFRGDDVKKRVSVLSGGEKNRLALARMLVRPANCLLLDEPTNHLDIPSKTVLQAALRDFGGTFLIVSHDRDFLDPIVTKVIEVSHGGRLRAFPGNVSEYLAKVEAEGEAGPGAGLTTAKAAATASPDGRRHSTAARRSSAPEPTAKERRRAEAERRRQLAPFRNRAEELEKRVTQLEQSKEEMETQLADPAFYQQNDAFAQRARDYDKVKRDLEGVYREWEKAAAALEKAEAEADAAG